MPYDINNPPSWLKNLPVGAQSLGIRVFNAVYAKTKNEDQARIAAWAQIKRKYKKVGDKWVKMGALTKSSATEELLMKLAHSSEAPGLEFTLEEVIVQTILQNPLHWGPEQKYYLISIAGGITMVFDNNPLESEDATLLSDELPLQPYTKIKSKVKLDSGTILMMNLLEFKGKKFSGKRLLKDFQLGKDSTSVDLSICMAASKDSMKFTRNGNLLYFEALALASGVWTGIDGHTMKYDAGVIMEGSKSFPFQRIKSRHKNRDVDVVGFTTGVAMRGDQAWIQGFVFDQQEIQEIEGDIASGKPIGISPELRSMTSVDSDGVYVAHSILAKGFSFVDSPACKTSWVQVFRKLNPEDMSA